MVIGFGLNAALLLAVLGIAVHGWITGQLSRPLFFGALSALGCALVYGAIFVGRELGWWYIHGETLDNLALLWIPFTVGAGWLGWHLNRLP